jgi:hypothetical protein
MALGLLLALTQTALAQRFPWSHQEPATVVVQSEDGEPLDSRVWVWRWTLDDPATVAETGLPIALSRMVSLPAGESLPLSQDELDGAIVAHAEGHGIGIALLLDREQRIIRLPAARARAVKVVDPDGGPVQGAKVMPLPGSGTWEAGYRQPNCLFEPFAETTGPEGVAHVPRVNVDHPSLVAVSAPGYGTIDVAITDRGPVWLEPSGTLRIQVSGATDPRSLEGLVLAWVGRTQNRGSFAQAHCVIDANGRATVDLPAGEYSPTLLRPAASDWRLVEPPPNVFVGPTEDTPVTVELGRLVQVSGVVVDPASGRGAAASVRLRGSSLPRTYSSSVMSDGSFSADVLPGEHSLVIGRPRESPPQGGGMTISVPPEGLDGIVVEAPIPLEPIEPSQHYLAVLVRGPDGNPVPAARVFACNERGMSRASEMRFRGTATGRDGVALVSLAEPEEVWLSARWRGMATKEPVHVPAGEGEIPVELTLRPGVLASARGRVVDARGEPQRCRRVSVSPGVERTPWPDWSQAATVTDHLGYARFEGLWPEREYSLRLLDPSRRPVLGPTHRAEKGATVDLGVLVVESHDGRLTGTIADPDGKPIPGAAIWTRRTLQGPAYASTDDDGEFRLERLMPGPRIVVAEADGYRALYAEVGDDGPLALTLEPARPVAFGVPAPAPLVPRPSVEWIATALLPTVMADLDASTDERVGFSLSMAIAGWDPELARDVLPAEYGSHPGVLASLSWLSTVADLSAHSSPEEAATLFSQLDGLAVADPDRLVRVGRQAASGNPGLTAEIAEGLMALGGQQDREPLPRARLLAGAAHLLRLLGDPRAEAVALRAADGIDDRIGGAAAGDTASLTRDLAVVLPDVALRFALDPQFWPGGDEIGQRRCFQQAIRAIATHDPARALALVDGFPELAGSRDACIADLVGYFPPQSVEMGLMLARSLPSPAHRTRALAGLAWVAPEVGKGQIYLEALEAADVAGDGVSPFTLAQLAALGRLIGYTRAEDLAMEAAVATGIWDGTVDMSRSQAVLDVAETISLVDPDLSKTMTGYVWTRMGRESQVRQQGMWAQFRVAVLKVAMVVDPTWALELIEEWAARGEEGGWHAFGAPNAGYFLHPLRLSPERREDLLLEGEFGHGLRPALVPMRTGP